MKKMIKTKFRFFSFLLILLAAFFAATFSSCENAITDKTSEFIETQPTTETVAKPEVSNKGSIQIRINPDQIAGSSSRTVLPEISYDTITRVVLSGTHNGSTRTLQEWSSYYSVSSVLLELGYWDLTLTVVNNGKTFTSETETVEVVSGIVTPVSFTLSTSSTEGGISLYVEFEGDAVAASYRLLNFPTETVAASGDLTVATSPTKSVTFTRDAASNPVAKGTYRIEIKFYAAGNTLLNTYSEIVRVKGGFTSSASRYIDLNNLYNITYDADGGSILTGSYVEKYSLHSGTIDLPTLRRTGYEFVGWYKDSGLTDGPVTEFNVNTETSLTDKNFYAKWNRVCAITYYLANQAATADSDCIELTEDQCEEWGLVQSHTQGHETELPSQYIENENGEHITLAGYTLETLNGTALTITGSNYIIPATVTTNTDIYVSVKSHIAYIDPSITSDENNIPFNPSTPAKTVANALKWLKNADSSKNPVLYVKSTISNKTDIENLSDLSTPAASGGLYGAAIVKRHDSFTNGSLLSITENLTLQNVTLDGGAVWSNTQTEIEANPELFKTRTNNGLSSSIYLISTGTATGTATFEGVTIQNVDNTATNNNGNGAAVYINSGTLTLTNCHIKDCRSVRGAIFATMAGTINAVNTRFLCNNSIGSGSDKGHGGAVYLYGGTASGGQATFDACSFQYNAANAFGGAVYVGNNATATFKNQGLNSLENNFSDMATAAASRTCKGDFLYTKGKVTLLGDFIFGTGASALSFYIDNASSWHTITLGDSFGGASTTGTAKIYLSDTLENSVSQPVLSVVFGDSSVNMANAKTKFALAENDGNYLIDDNGLIKLIPGTVTVTPGFPGNYVCQWSQTVSGSTRTINIIVKDTHGDPLTVGTTAGTLNSVSVGIYEGVDLVDEKTLTSSTGLSFTYPTYLDPPSGTPFYVKFNVKVDETTQYSYDYWPEGGVTYVGEGLILVPQSTFDGTTAVPDSSVFISGRNIGTIKSLIVSDHEVTQGEYTAYCKFGGTQPSEEKGADDNYPAYYVNWYDAIIYCNLKTINDPALGLEHCVYSLGGDKDPRNWDYDGRDTSDGKYCGPSSENAYWNDGITFDQNADGWRLPTEAEWEYLARGGNLTGTQTTYSGSDTVDDVAWYSQNSGDDGTSTNKKSHEVKGKTANSLGLYDMSGNVWEWCWDRYSSSIDSSTPAVGVNLSTFNRVRRGGCFALGASYAEVSYRYGALADSRSSMAYYGFRVVRSSD